MHEYPVTLKKDESAYSSSCWMWEQSQHGVYAMFFHSNFPPRESQYGPQVITSMYSVALCSIGKVATPSICNRTVYSELIEELGLRGLYPSPFRVCRRSSINSFVLWIIRPYFIVELCGRLLVALETKTSPGRAEESRETPTLNPLKTD